MLLSFGLNIIKITVNIPVDCRTGKGLNAFIPTVNKALADVIEKNKARGMENKPLRLMVVGIPNTGKSSFINRMAGNSKAKVADKAGVTRQNFLILPVFFGLSLTIVRLATSLLLQALLKTKLPTLKHYHADCLKLLQKQGLRLFVTDINSIAWIIFKAGKCLNL